MLDRLHLVRSWTVAQRVGAGVAAVLTATITAALVTSGPGNDLDVANVFRSGRSIARNGSYVPSRAPGSPVHETIVGVLDLIGGPLLTNLASVVAAVVLLVGLDRLLVAEGVTGHGRWATAIVAANPWFVVAATSSADYVFALAFVVVGANALRTGRPVWAGVLMALSVGCRLTSAVLVAAVLVAELTRRPPVDDEGASEDAPEHRTPAAPGGSARGSFGWHRAGPQRLRMVGAAGLVSGVVSVLLFVPAYLHAGDLSFAHNDFRTSTLGLHLGRTGAKDLALLGTVGSVVALGLVPGVIAVLRLWRTSWLVRFATIGLVASQLVFLRFPWKMAHLLPSLLCGAVLVAVAAHRRPGLRWLVAAVVLTQVLYGVVRVDLIHPDDPHHATGARFELTVDRGPVLADWRCRRDHPDPHLGRQRVEVEAAWTCARQYGE